MSPSARHPNPNPNPNPDPNPNPNPNPNLAQLCTLATLFFALMMKIGFFEEEGVPKDVMGQILIYIMFLPAG